MISALIGTFFQEGPILKFLAFLAIAVVLTVLRLICEEILIYLFPRKDALPVRYPGEELVVLIKNQANQLEMINEYIELSKEFNKKRTTILQCSVMPTFVATTDVVNVQHILKENWKNYGKTGSTFKPRMQGLLGDGIFNSDGHQWYAHRKTSAHLFKMNKFKGNILDVFNDDLNQLITKIRSFGDKSFDIHDYLHRFTLESISRVAFGISLGCITNPEINFAKDFDYCTMCVNDSFLNPLWRLERYFTPKGWKYYYCLYRINSYAKKIVQERRQEVARGEGLDKSDLLTLYLDTSSFQDILNTSSSEGASQEDLNAFMEPTDKNLRDVILNMVIAGRDTTAQALSWAFFRMCTHPETQERLREEAREIYTTHKKEGSSETELEALQSGNGLGAVSFNAIQGLKYTEAFCMEVLRLHPSVPKEAKEVFEDDVWPDGTVVKKGDVAAFLPWSMGRDKDLWGPDAEEFKPERFLDQAKPSPFKFIAFQAGPRTCLGQNFAMLEMKCVLSRLLLCFEFSLAQDPKSVTYDISLTLPIKGGLKVTAKSL